MRKILLLVLVVIVANVQAQKIQWQKCLGGSADENAFSIQQTTDGGYIVAGSSNSNDGDIIGNHGENDYAIIKLSSAGIIQWKKTFGGSNDDIVLSIQQTIDGGYIAAGHSKSNDGDVSGHHGDTSLYDCWIVKLDHSGTIQWQKSLGGSGWDISSCIQQTSDGGYILAGSSNSNDGDVSGFHGGFYSDYWVVKLNNSGIIQWQKTYGGSKLDMSISIQQTNDGGYIVAGESSSNDGDVSGNHGIYSLSDCWIVKFDNLGTIQWQKSLGGSSTDFARSIQQTSDGGYIASGSSYSTDGDVTGHSAGSSLDCWIVKLNSVGDIEWQKCFGGSGLDDTRFIRQTNDGGYIVAGFSNSTNGDITNNHGGYDSWILKLNSMGAIEWQNCFGGSADDDGQAIQQSNDGGYIVAGSSSSNDGNVTGHHGVATNIADFWIVKLALDKPVISGTIYLDPNSNSLHDTLEPFKSNVKVQLSNGNYTFTDNNGYYQIQADSIGSYTLTITPPTGYNALPASVTYNFTSYDTTVTKDIALQPATVLDSVAINVIPMVMNAVQGNAMPYWVEYTNAGTTTLSPTVALTYNNYLLAYDSCNDANATPISNGVVTAALNMQPGTTKNFVSYFTVKPSANVGDTLTTVYSITTPSINQTDSFYMIIEGGVAPPNAQRATQSITTAQVASGKDIVYTIGFKNTGSDTAFNVVITDTLSSLLKANTVQMLSSSHICKTTVKGNIVTFELLNIKLPKATINNLKSMGFVSFKVKPQTTLVAGNIITNKANTYYNYRTPQTSIAITIVKNVITPVRITNYEASPTPPREGLSNWTVLNKWATSTEINTSHFNIQRSENGKEFKTVGIITAKGTGGYSFIDPLTNNLPLTIYCRLEIVDKDGSKTYSEVKRVTLNEKQETRNIVLFPNPAKDIVTITSKESIKAIKIINQLGQVLEHISNINKTSYIVHLTSYNKGVYIVQITTTNGVITNEKLIVE